MPNVYLAMPSHGQDDFMAKASLWRASRRSDVRISPGMGVNSLLTHNFNTQWCLALNQREEKKLTHFAMVHSDIAAEDVWLDKLLAEKERIGADVLSVVVPLKDPAMNGTTSTAVCDRETETDWWHRRLTIKDMNHLKLPDTFSINDFGAMEAAKYALLVNTGCWVCDFTKPWVEEIHFHQTDKIFRQPDGKFKAETFSEDWNFSLDCARLGVKVFATFCVKVKHAGRYEWSNER